MTPVAGAVKESVAGGTAGAAGVAGPETGLGARLDAARSALASVVADLDPARLTGADAAGLYASLVALERLVVAGKTLLAPRIEGSGVWRDGGHRSAAVMLASLEGVATGQAQSTLVQRAAPLTVARDRSGAAHRGALGTEGHRADRGRHPRPRTGARAAGRGRGGSPPGGAGAVPAVPGHLGVGGSPGQGRPDPSGPVLLVVDRRRGGLLLPGPGHPRPGSPDPLPPGPGGHPAASDPTGGRGRTGQSRTGGPSRRLLRPSHKTPPRHRGTAFAPAPAHLGHRLGFGAGSRPRRRRRRRGRGHRLRSHRRGRGHPDAACRHREAAPTGTPACPIPALCRQRRDRPPDEVADQDISSSSTGLRPVR